MNIQTQHQARKTDFSRKPAQAITSNEFQPAAQSDQVSIGKAVDGQERWDYGSAFGAMIGGGFGTVAGGGIGLVGSTILHYAANMPAWGIAAGAVGGAIVGGIYGAHKGAQ